MSEESAFIQMLGEHPADDTTRLVYADWLDERDESLKAEYLRLVVSLVHRCDDIRSDQADVIRLKELVDLLPFEWRKPAGNRFMVVYYHLSNRTQKIATIKCIREIGGIGLAQAKRLSEEPPSTLLNGVPFEQALAARDHLLTVQGTLVRVHPMELDPLPLSVVYRVEAVCNIWDTGPDAVATRQEATTAYAAFLRSMLGISSEAAKELAQKERNVIVDGLNLRTAQIRVAELRPLLPPSELTVGWSLWIALATRAVNTPSPH